MKYVALLSAAVLLLGYSTTPHFPSSYFSTPESHVKIDIPLIKACATKGITSFDMLSVSGETDYLPDDLIIDSLGQIPINGQKGRYLTVNEQERVRCYQWEAKGKYFLFTILQTDVSNYLNMYICVADKKSNVLAISQLGRVGEADGRFENESGEKIRFGKFRLSQYVIFDKELYKDEVHIGFERQYERTESVMAFKKGAFQFDTIQHTKGDTIIKK